MKTTPGKFALADKGTVFLDEIGDMDFKLQGKLLQVLQDREYLPLGAREVQKVDVRIIAATHRDIKADIALGRFREDLYYRLDVINVYVPALRYRKDEILPIARVLLEKHRITEEAPEIPEYLAQALLDYEWPGNVRELENVVKRLIVFRDPDAILEYLYGRSQQNGEVRRQAAELAPAQSSVAASLAVGPGQFSASPQFTPPVQFSPAAQFGSSLHSAAQHVAQHITQPTSQYAPQPAPLETRSNVFELPSELRTSSVPVGADALAAFRRSRDSEEIDFIVRVLDSTRWNRRKAAVLLQMEYKTLLYRMKKLGIDQRATGT